MKNRVIIPKLISYKRAEKIWRERK